MKNYMNLFLIAVATILIAVSCTNESTPTNNANAAHAQITRAAGVQENVTNVTFQGKTISIKSEDIIQITQNANAEANAEVVTDLNSAFMGAEKTAQTLDVTFTASEEPIDNGMYIFGIKSEEQKELQIEMFDEEGFSTVANNKFSINEGNNHKALNVKSLDNGTYNFRLTDVNGNELNRQLTIANPE